MMEREGGREGGREVTKGSSSHESVRRETHQKVFCAWEAAQKSVCEMSK